MKNNKGRKANHPLFSQHIGRAQNMIELYMYQIGKSLDLVKHKLILPRTPTQSLFWLGEICRICKFPNALPPNSSDPLYRCIQNSGIWKMKNAI